MANFGSSGPRLYPRFWSNFVSPVQRQRPNPILRVAFPILLFFLFTVFTGILEWTGFLYWARPLLVVGTIGLIVIAVSGRLMPVVLSPVGKILTLFTVWFIFCIPFAIWRGGSFNIFVNLWSKSYLAYILTAGLILTLAQMRTVFHTIAYSIGFLACLALVANRYDFTGRLGLIGSRYGNANEFGFTLLIGMIFLAFVYLRSTGYRKALAVMLMLPVLVALAKTGSRGCLLGAFVLFVFVFIEATPRVRARMVFALPILVIGLALAAPSHLRSRYTTVFKPQDEHSTYNEAEAIGSTELRLQLLKDSITTTLMHPLFGVGAGNFMVYQEQLALDRGDAYGLWHVTHNSYTQLSSELGFPGLLIFLAFLYQCWRTLSGIHRRRYLSKEVVVMSQTLRAAFLVLVTVAFFDSVAYAPDLPIMAGLATALSFIARDQRPPVKTESKHEETMPQLPEPEYETALTSPLYN